MLLYGPFGCDKSNDGFRLRPAPCPRLGMYPLEPAKLFGTYGLLASSKNALHTSNRNVSPFGILLEVFCRETLVLAQGLMRDETGRANGIRISLCSSRSRE